MGLNNLGPGVRAAFGVIVRMFLSQLLRPFRVLLDLVAVRGPSLASVVVAHIVVDTISFEWDTVPVGVTY